jgi:surface antigen
MKSKFIIFIGIICLLLLGFYFYNPLKINYLTKFNPVSFGEKLDDLNGIIIYSNGIDYSQSHGKHYHSDGYYFGHKWQCVEFVKRYYYLHLHHKMPNLYGHAISYFNPTIKHGQLNKERNLIQYQNGKNEVPKINDLMVFRYTQYGHVAIVSKVEKDKIEIAQQNTGSKTRTTLDLTFENGKYFVGDERTLGWLRKSN